MNEEITKKNNLTSQLSVDESLDTLLGEVAGEFFDRMTNGERPQIEDYVARYPELAEQIRAAFPALQIVGDSRAENNGKRTDIDLAGQKTLGDFRIVGELGRGGMGVVYEAEQLSMGRKVALKVLPFAALAQEKSLQRFRNEVRAAGSLNHPNIVPIYAVGEERGVHFFAMQLIRGQSMADVIVQLARLQSDGESLHADSISQALSVVKKPNDRNSSDEPTLDLPSHSKEATNSTPPNMQETQRETQARISTEGQTQRSSAFLSSAVRLGVQAAEALQNAHDLGVLHRDIKPGNLMLDAEGQLYITDFGLARIETDVGVTMTGDIVGTLRYMSPEQLLGKRVVIDQRCDIYSLGVTLYELLTLRPPYDGVNRQELINQIAFETPPTPRQICRSIPRELETIILKAIEKNPDERYATAQELADDLHAFLEDRPIKAKPPTLVQRTAKWSRRHKPLVWSASASAALLLILGMTLLAISNRVITQERNQKADALAQRTAALDGKNRALSAADANFKQALEAVDQMLIRVGRERLQDVPEMKLIQGELLQDALKLYGRLLEQDPENLDVQFRMAQTRVALGNIQKLTGSSSTGNVQFRAAIATLDDLMTRSPNEPMFQSQLAFTYNMLGWAHSPSSEEAEQAHRNAAALYDSLVTVYPEESDYRWQLAHCYQSIAQSLFLRDELDNAEDFARQAIALFRDSDEGGHIIQAAAYNKLAKILANKKEFEKADVAYVNAIRIRRKFQLELPPHSTGQHHLAVMLVDYGTMLQQLNRFDQADECYSEACEIWELLQRSYPNVPTYGDRLTQWQNTRFDLWIATGQQAKVYQMLAKSDPRTATDDVGKEDLDRSSGKARKEFDDLLAVVQLEPDNWSVHKRLPELLWWDVDIPKSHDLALMHAVRCVQIEPENPVSWNHFAHSHFMLGNLDEAWNGYDQAMKLDPTAAFAYHGKAIVLRERGEIERSLEFIAKGLEIAPKHAQLRRTRGEISLDLKDYETAVSDLSFSLEKHPAGHIYKRRALAHFHLGHFKETLADIAKAVELSPSDASIFTWISPKLVADCPDETLIDGMLELADATVEKYDNVNVRIARAELLVANGGDNLAIRDFDIAIELEPDNVAWRDWRIGFFAERTRWPELKAVLAKAIELKPNDHIKRYQSGLIAVALSDQAAYRETCKQMLMTFADPDAPPEASSFTSWTCALASNSVEDYAAAIRLAQYALDKGIDDQQFRTHLGAILMRAGMYTEAKDHFNIALKSTENAKTSLNYIRYFLAMTEHHLGRQQSAKDLLETANQSAEEELSGSPAWNRRLTLELLRNEAETLIANAVELPRANGENQKTPSTSSPTVEPTGS